MNTTVYLIRHSVRFSMDDIDIYNTTQNNIIKNEKVILSVEGEKRAEILSNEKELQNIDVVYTSNCVRTLQTAKYLLEKQNLKVNIDERFDERRIGKPNADFYKNWFKLQFLDENFKTEGGESQKEVRTRFNEAFNEVLRKNEGKRIAIFSHGYAILFFLINWCSIEYEESTDRLKFTYNGEDVFNKKINAPEVFKLEFDGNKLKSIRNIVFDDLPYKEGTGKDKLNILKNVSRISIIGGSGCGKSTLADILSKKLDIPAVHLDAINYKENWVEIDKAERDRKIEEKANEEKWIIDGNYNKTLKQRLKKADLVIWLDYSTCAQLKGVLKRYIHNHNREKEELPGCKERFNLKFYKYVLTYNQKKRPEVIKMLEGIPKEKVIIFKKQKDLNKWLENMRCYNGNIIF